MELLAQSKKKLTLLLIFFKISTISAQHQIDKDVAFNYKGNNKYVPLNTFLGHYKIDEKDLGKCMVASGIIKFQVTPKGKIVSIDTKGDLPSILIEALKERILLTENCWVFSDAVIKANKNIEFYYPIYMSISLEDKCNTSIHESLDLLSILFKDQKVLHIKDQIYFIKPEIWSAIK